VSSVDRVRDEGGEKPEDAVRKLQRLKKALGRARVGLANDDGVAGSTSLAKRVVDLIDEMKLWEDSFEEIRCELAELIAERDSWRISHDKLRERMDRHTLEPRSEPDKKPQSARLPTTRVRTADESQDFTAIDKELELLNASMLRAFSSSSE
jgi:regulator of replication initiation timing